MVKRKIFTFTEDDPMIEVNSFISKISPKNVISINEIFSNHTPSSCAKHYIVVFYWGF